MEGVCEKGLARNIGVSNFNAQSVMDLLKCGFCVFLLLNVLCVRCVFTDRCGGGGVYR
jgi:aryl-alcohol dehydrogenase-like predicted oxidoreductase